MKTKSVFAFIIAFALLMAQTVSASSPINDNTSVNYENMDDISELINSVPQEFFAGVYYNEEGELVLRLKGSSEATYYAYRKSIPSTAIIEYSRYSLAELEAMKDAIVPYMIEYGIASLDANESTGMIDIQISQPNDRLVSILSDLCDIDPEIIRVSVAETNFEFTIASAPAESVPDEYYEIFGIDASSARSSISTPIIPGMNIAVSNSGMAGVGCAYGTAGPRYTDGLFFSAGHLITGQVSSPRVLAAASLSEIGRVTSYVLGSSGDRSTIQITNSSFSLPTSNSLGVNGGMYTHTYTSVMGARVEMWGAYSGISTGRVLATNQVLTVSGITVRNLTKTDYSCQRGDSGAAVFSLNAAYDPSAKCYGIQSIGDFDEEKTVANYSYYSPISGYGF